MRRLQPGLDRGLAVSLMFENRYSVRARVHHSAGKRASRGSESYQRCRGVGFWDVCRRAPVGSWATRKLILAFRDGPARSGTLGLSMSDRHANSEPELLRRWVDTWRHAGQELDKMRRREIESADTQEAVLQIFGTGDDPIDLPPPPATSGLVEQQAWFAKVRAANPRR